MNSTYNQKGDKDDKSINSYGFKEGYIIPTTKEQDKIIKETFISISKNEDYSLNPYNPNHCGTTVQRSLNKAGIQTSTSIEIPANHWSGRTITLKTNPYFPSKAYKAIIRNNPSGTSIQRENKTK